MNTPWRRIPWHRTGLLLLIACISLSCSPVPDTQPTPAKKKRPPSIHWVETQLIKQTLIQQRFQANGTLIYRRLRHIFNQEEGQLIDFPFFEGDQVQQKQRLFKLHDQLLQAQLDKATAQLRQANNNLGRIQNLSNKRAASKDSLGQAQTDLDIATADLSLITTRLAFTQDHAPFDGIITERRVETGDVVKRHSHLLTLIDPTSLRVKVNVSELVMPKLSLGDPVKIALDALKVKNLSGHIQRIHPLIHPQTRQGIIEVQFDTLPPSATAGQFARVTFLPNPHLGILIPFNSIQHRQQGTYVWLMDSQKTAQQTAITTGIRLNQQIEVLTGLSPQQQLITRGFSRLKPNKTVSNRQDNELTHP